MKTQKLVPVTKNLFAGILLTTIIFLVPSCAIYESFLNSSVVPAAQGSVKIKKDNNDNYLIKLQIEDLAEVERLQSSKQMYVVWLETEKGVYENLGQLHSSSGFMSKQLTASLEAMSPYKPVRIFVTAENESSVQYPDEVEILTTNKFYK